MGSTQIDFGTFGNPPIELSAQVGPADGPMPDEATMRKIIAEERDRGFVAFFDGGKQRPSLHPIDSKIGRRCDEPVFSDGRFVCYRKSQQIVL